MNDNTRNTAESQASPEDSQYTLAYLDMPYRIYSQQELEPYAQGILSRMYAFARACDNNIFAGADYFAENYGVARSTIQTVVSQARKLGLMHKDSYKFKDISTFQKVPKTKLDDGFPSMLHIPEVALHHPKLSWADKKLFGIIHYKRNKIDGTLCKTRKEMIQYLDITVEQYRGKIKKFSKLGLVEISNNKNKQILKMAYLKTEIQAELDYKNTREDLSTAENRGGEGTRKGGCIHSKGGVRALEHIKNNISNKNKYYDATPLNEKEEKKEHDYVPNWKKQSQACSTVLEYDSPEYRKRQQATDDLAAESRRRGDAQMKAFMERKQGKTGKVTNETRNAPEGTESAIRSLGQMLGKDFQTNDNHEA